MCFKLEGLKTNLGETWGTKNTCFKLEGLKANLGETWGTKSYVNPNFKYALYNLNISEHL